MGKRVSVLGCGVIKAALICTVMVRPQATAGAASSGMTSQTLTICAP